MNYTSEEIGELLSEFAPPPAKWLARAERVPRSHGRRRPRVAGLFRPLAATAVAHAAEPAEELPAHSLRRADFARIAVEAEWPEQVTREWAWGGSTGKGIRVCVVDSGVDGGHPLVTPLEGAVAVSRDAAGAIRIAESDEGDLCGHGTACASIIRALAPECSLFSVRVLGAGFTGSGALFAAGVRWALDQGFEVVNMSLSTTKREFGEMLHGLADEAYFQRTILVASAHNLPIEDSYPWRFSSLVSVGSHPEQDPSMFFYNPTPPVEFFARGVDVEVAWAYGGTIRATGNSFAAPHISGLCALALAKHPELKPFQLKDLLYLTATNVGGD